MKGIFERAEPLSLDIGYQRSMNVRARFSESMRQAVALQRVTARTTARP